MINEADRHRIGQARLLRRQGKTYNEIREVIGDVSDDRLRQWLKAIPRPPETWRANPHTALRLECRRLRAQGLTFTEISHITGASKGSISPWTRDIRPSARIAQLRKDHLDQLRGKGARAVHEAATERRKARVEYGRRAVGELTDRELFVVGVALYWAEGAKDKPWRRHGRVRLINSDPTVLRTFLAWLDLVGVPESARRYRLNIHLTADIEVHEAWWAAQLGVSRELFQRATLKRHNPKPTRHNRGETYHGCLIVDVAKSTALYHAIDGWWHGIVFGMTVSVAGTGLGCEGIYPGSSNGRTRSFGLRHGGSTPSPGARILGSSLHWSREGSVPWLPPRWWDEIGQQ